MNRENYERKKAFAGEKKPSMLRRCVDHDYTERQMYMITMATEGRRPLLGRVVGRCDAPVDTAEVPRVELTELGCRVAQNWQAIARLYPQVKIVALQMMPDHFHGVLFVQSKLDRPLGKVLLGFKQGCNKAYRELVLGLPVQSAAVVQQQTQRGEEGQAGRQEEQAGRQERQAGRQERQAGGPEKQAGGPDAGQPEGQQQAVRPKDDRSHGLLFERGYNDRILLRDGQLQTWLHYLADNPRRLLMKREHPDLFRVQRGLQIGPLTFAAQQHGTADMPTPRLFTTLNTETT